MTARALALRALGLGDLLAGVPALRALRRALPEHQLVLAAPAVLQPLVRFAGAVDVLLPAGELQPVPWSGPPPDVAVDLHGNGPASRRLLEALLPGRLVAFGSPDGRGRPAGPRWDPEEHERARWCRLVGESFGTPADPDDLLLGEPDRAPVVTDAVVVHVGAAAPSRRWPEDRFAAVAAWARSQGLRVVLTGAPAEEPAARRVAAAAGVPAADVVAGRTDLTDLAALVAAARLVVVGDTGVAHLASAYRTPSVVLFGPVPPAQWGPPPGPHTVLWHGTGRGDPHGQETDRALLRLEAEEVITAAALRIGSPSSGTGAGGRCPAARPSTAAS